MSDQKSPPAFPIVLPTPSQWHFEEGMSLRDYFAAKAMEVFVAEMVAFYRYDLEQDAQGDRMPTNASCADFSHESQMWASQAKASYAVADAMLATRQKTMGNPDTRDELLKALEAAMKYISLSPCDPDIYPDQLAAWQKLQSLKPDQIIAKATGKEEAK